MFRLIFFLLPIILLFIGIQMVREYFGSVDKDKRVNLEMLISQGQDVIGTLSDEYMEHTVKIKRVPIVTYEFDYSFKVGDTAYTGKKTYTSLPSDQEIKIKYLSSDPNNHAIDAEEELAKLKSSIGKTSNLLIGLGLTLAGLLLGLYRLRPKKSEA